MPKHLLSTVVVATLGSIAVAQTPSVNWKPKAGDPVDTIFMETNLGSFRLINGKGRVEFSFTGTVLVSGLKGTVTPTGNVRKEYDKNGRVAYFGTGKMVVDGEWRAVQWFGRNMKGTWWGAGIVRMYGEFDSKLDTGLYWFASDPEKKYWSPYGTERVFPLPKTGRDAKPIPRSQVPKKNP